MIADSTGRQKDTLLEFGIDGAGSLLDVGCGNGDKTYGILPHVRQAVGIDPDENQIGAAKKKYDCRNLAFQVARAEALCFAEASFATVLFNESLHHVPVDHQVQALREGCRVLKAKGRLLITEPIHGSGAFGRTLALYRDEKKQKQIAVEAIETVMQDAFELRARTEIQIEYRFQGADDFFAYYGRNTPDPSENPALKRDIRARLDRCRKNAQGDLILDYAASVWQLVKR